MQATQVTVRVRSSGGGEGNRRETGVALPWNAEDRLLPLNGVVAVGAVADVPNTGSVRTVPVIDPSGEFEHTVPVLAGSAGLGDALRVHLRSGRWFDAGHVERGDPVAIIGADLADELGIRDVSRQPAMYLGEGLLVVIGIVDESPRDRGLLGSILIPSSVAEERFDVAHPRAHRHRDRARRGAADRGPGADRHQPQRTRDAVGQRAADLDLASTTWRRTSMACSCCSG